MAIKSPFYEHLSERIAAMGGMYNAHLHLDRSGTLEVQSPGDTSEASVARSLLSLKDKHGLITSIHGGASFTPEDIARRVNGYVDAMIVAGTRRADTLVDIGDDGIGLSSLHTLLDIKERRKADIELRVGAYCPLGFVDAEPKRWELLAEGAAISDFIGSLPERDNRALYPDHIGFHQHCRRILKLASEHDKPVQIHLDQQNNPLENDTEKFLQILDETADPPATRSGDPAIWLVHVISPSRYEEGRFEALLNSLARHNLGVICCPSAAISMRQLRGLRTPTSNSIARVLEMLAAGVHVCLGSDNIADIFSPAGTPDLMDEVFILCNALRFYNIDILAKLAAGARLSEEDRQLIAEHLRKDRDICESIIAIDSNSDN